MLQIQAAARSRMPLEQFADDVSRIRKAEGELGMSSLELVDFINAQRKEGEAALRHADFLAKVPKVLGESLSENFRSAYKDSTGRKLPCYNFPKREACLMIPNGIIATILTSAKHLNLQKKSVAEGIFRQ